MYVLSCQEVKSTSFTPRFSHSTFTLSPSKRRGQRELVASKHCRQREQAALKAREAATRRHATVDKRVPRNVHTKDKDDRCPPKLRRQRELAAPRQSGLRRTGQSQRKPVLAAVAEAAGLSSILPPPCLKWNNCICIGH